MEQGPPHGVERRRHPRYELIAQVRVKHAQTDYIVELDNISLSGVHLHLGTLKRPTWLSPNRLLEIGIVHPVDLELVEVKGRVVRIDEDEKGTLAGVAFEQVDEATARHIARLVDTAKLKQGPPPLPKG